MTMRLLQGCRRLCRSRAGASAMEFAILSVPMAALLIGVLEFARLEWTRNAVEQVSVDGARCAGLHAVSCSDNGSPRLYNAAKTLTYIQNRAGSLSVNVPTSEITVSTSSTCQGIANFVEVTINHSFTSGMLTVAGYGNYTVSSSACYPNQG